MKSRDDSGHAVRVRADIAEFSLLVRILANDAAGTARNLEADPGLLDSLAETCIRSGLSVALFRALEASPMQSALEPARIGRLEEALRRQTERQRVLERALFRMAQLFDSQKQPFILLKGPYLSRRFFGGAVGREYADIDLLVPDADRFKACALIESAGYRRQSRIFLHEGLTRFFVHAFDYHSRDARMDLHWRLCRHPSLHIDEKRLWATRASFRIDGYDFNVLSDEYEIVFAALSLLRDIERGRPKAKNVVDLVRIAMTVDASLDWDKVLSARDGTARPVRRVLRLCLEKSDSHDLAKNLAEALARHGRGHESVSNGSAEAPLRFKPGFLSLGNKIWAARAYETSLLSWLSWWALSLPFRLAVHRKPPLRFRQSGRGLSC